MTTKFSAFTAASTPVLTDQAVGLQSSSNVRYTFAQLAALFGLVKFAANVGDGTNVSYTVNHNIGTRDVQVTVYRNATPFDEVIVDVQHTDANNITLLFSVPPTSNQFRCVVWG